MSLIVRGIDQRWLVGGEGMVEKMVEFLEKNIMLDEK